MRRKIAIGLALAMLGGGFALAEEKPDAGAVTITVPGFLNVEVPGAPEIDVPEVPKPKETRTPKIEVPEVPKLDLPGIDPGAGEALADATAKPEESAQEAEAAARDPDVDAALDALGEAAYRSAYEALLNGEVIHDGSAGEAAKGVQQTLIALGQPIAADGIVGPKTLAALNAAQTELGLEPTPTLDAPGYAALLKALAQGK